MNSHLRAAREQFLQQHGGRPNVGLWVDLHHAVLDEEILDQLHQEIGRPGVQLEEDTPLVSSGLIDSMALVGLLGKLEDLTQRRIPAGKVQPKDLDTIRLMLATAERVHGKTGATCPVCGDTIREVSFADSSLQYCATCQTGGKPLADRRLSRLLK